MSTEVENSAPELNNGTTNGVSATNGKDVTLPTWLQAQLFEELLKDTVKGFKQIKNFNAESALAAGENYATIMLSIKIDLELQDGSSKLQSYMLKVPQDVRTFESLLKHNIFEKEAGVYREVVPEFEQMYRDVNVNVRFGANHYELQLPEKQDNILLEDLRLRGFRNVKRQDGLDLEHAKALLKKLAQWHAASAARVALKGNYKPIYHDSHFDESQKEVFKKMAESMKKEYLQCAKSFKGYEIYGEDLENLNENATDWVFDVIRINPEEFNVLNHGDCWANNIMFQYDEHGKVKETYLVDYQMVTWGSPAIDLYYFLISSTQLKIKVNKFDYLTKYYHDNLVKHLKLLNYSKKVPTLKELHITLLKFGVWGYITASGIMAAVLVDPSENAKIDNFFEESTDANSFKMLMYNNSRYRQHIETVLPWLHNRGAMSL